MKIELRITLELDIIKIFKKFREKPTSCIKDCASVGIYIRKLSGNNLMDEMEFEDAITCERSNSDSKQVEG